MVMSAHTCVFLYGTSFSSDTLLCPLISSLPWWQVPFPELHGEFTEYVGRAEDAIIAMSRYRLHIKFKESIVNVSTAN